MNLIESVISMFLLGIPQFLLGTIRIIVTNNFPFVPYNFETTALPQNSYDFIVVGAGCAGSAVASRLSETGASVLLLEAGGNAPPESSVPALTPFLLGSPEVTWRVKPVPQNNVQIGFVNSSAYLFMGKMMGGGTAMNGMVYVRGNKEDYNNWARLGNTGWSYDEVLPYFKKSEDFRGRPVPGSEGHHSKGGLVPVESRQTHTQAGEAFLKAGIELGYNLVDGAGPDQIGVGPVYTTTKNGVRASSAENFLKPFVKSRPNLTVRPKAMVTRVLFNSERRAVGVQYIVNGKRRIAAARKEVILSAGSINTPKLLMLSGVGPTKHLQNIGIPVISALEGVGQNLQDHPTLYITYIVPKRRSTSLLEFLNLKDIAKYLRTGKGLLGDSIGLECNGWFNLNQDHDTWSDVQLSMASVSFALDRGLILAEAYGMKRQFYSEIYGPLTDKPTLTINPMLGRPKSRGTVILASPDPLDNPIVDPKYFSHPDDMKLMIKAIRQSQLMANTKAIKNDLGARYHNKKLSHCAGHGADTDAYWECYVRHVVSTLWHYSGTAKMAPDSDPMGVVSSKLRVRGVTGLRVVDGSVMPLVVTSNTQAPIYMIAEKASDMIKQDWGYPVDPLPN